MDIETLEIRWPKWLRRGILFPDGSLSCPKWGLNCVSVHLDPSISFVAPGPKSRFHDPILTELAQNLNEAIRRVAEYKHKSDGHAMLSILLLEEGFCFS